MQPLYVSRPTELLSFINMGLHPFPFHFSNAICFSSEKIKPVSPVALFKSIGVKCVKYVFRCCLCMLSKRVYACFRAYAHVCHRSRPGNNKHCL